MANVIKKDGSKEPFDIEKVKKAVVAAAQDTDVSEERKNDVMGKITEAVQALLGEREEISSADIKEKILSELDAMEPSISASWRKYDAEKAGA